MQPFRGKIFLFGLSFAVTYLLILLIHARCFAQSPDIKFKLISIEQGLSNSWIEAICQDARGFMWFGSRDGLDRYDGKQIKVYRTNAKDTTTISDNFIRYIYEDREHMFCFVFVFGF